jgi:glutamate-1-semialdehyde aminotransferase
LEEGTVFTTAHAKELEVAEKLIELIPCAEMLAFFVGGSAAVTGALRLARAYTGRDMVIRCGYHGWHDWARPGDVGVPKAVSELTLETPYGDLDALEALFRKCDGRVACAIIETVQGDGPPEGYLQGCVDVAHRFGALCVFDEIKVGFRIALGGASEYYGVLPDLACYGKACCNGHPGSFVAGRRAVLGSEACRGAWLAATFHCDLLSLVALETVIGEMRRRDGIAWQWRMGRRLIEGVNQACEEGGVGYRLTGIGPMPRPVAADDDRDRCLAMLRGCLARGCYLQLGHPMFLSLAHTEQDIADTIAAVRESVAEVT